MDYNTQREKLVLPEYGRHVQKMIEQVKAIEDKEKRSQQMRAVVQVMGILNPQIREFNDYKHKLWDHAHVIGGFDLDIDAPFPAPTPQQFEERPDVISLPERPIKAACYGRNIENMIALIADREEDDTKKEMIRVLALYMRQQYLIWNKDNVAEETSSPTSNASPTASSKCPPTSIWAPFPRTPISPGRGRTLPRTARATATTARTATGSARNSRRWPTKNARKKPGANPKPAPKPARNANRRPPRSGSARRASRS